jgi:hypothetical protein
MSWPLHEGESADDQQNAQKDNPCFRREEKSTYCDRTEDKQHETDILRFFVEIKAFTFTAVMTHSFTPLIFYEKD